MNPIPELTQELLPLFPESPHNPSIAKAFQDIAAGMWVIHSQAEPTMQGGMLGEMFMSNLVQANAAANLLLEIIAKNPAKPPEPEAETQEPQQEKPE